MKIYIHTDLEGVAGLDAEEQRDYEKKDIYRQSCEKLTLDVNAAVAGAFDGGADHVTVLDAHAGDRQNFILDMLDKRAENDVRSYAEWWGKLGQGYDATFFVGAHAMAGTVNGFLDHTMNSTTIYNYCINGRRVGELAIWAIVAGGFGVPMVMVSGDEAACAEARAFLGPMETAPVKQGVGRNKAIAYPVDEARARIREAARKAIGLIGQVKPFKLIAPMEVRLECTRSDYCDGMAALEGVERLDARTLRIVARDHTDILPWRSRKPRAG